MTDEFSDIINDISTAHVEGGQPFQMTGNSDDIYGSSPPNDTETDSTGTAFDPTKHAINRETGKPSKTKSGKFRAKRGGPSKINTTESDVGGAEVCAGVLAANLFMNMGMMMFGDEWQPENEGEVKAMEGAWTDYLDEKGIDDLPAGVTLAIVMGGYAAKRLSKPKTSSKIIYGMGWIKGKFSRNGARNNSRPQRVRENNTSETANQKRGWFGFAGAGA